MNPNDSHKPKHGDSNKPKPGVGKVDPDEAARRAQKRALALVLGALVAAAGVVLLVLWLRAGHSAFFIRDAQTGENMSDSLLAVVIDARRKPADPFPTSAALLPGDVFGRYEPAPLAGDEVSEIFVYHIAKKPIARGTPKDGTLTLEPHGGATFPEIEAQLRALGEMSPPVAAALKAAFLPAGPASKDPITVASGTSVGPSSGPSGASSAGGTEPDGEPWIETGTGALGTTATATDKERREADSLAREIEQVLRDAAARSPEWKKKRAHLIETLDLYNELAPRDARLKGSGRLMRMVARGLENRSAFDLVRRLTTLAGALWHGTGSAPPPFTGLADASLVWPDDARREVAIAAARIGGKGAARELGILLRAGKATLDAPLLAHLDAGGSRAALAAELAAELKALPAPSEEERARIEAAMAALKPR